MALLLKYATKSQVAAAFRERYRNATQIEACRLAKWLLDHIDDGTFTATQVQNAFGITVNQWNNTVQPKLSSQRDTYNAALAEAGQ